MSGLERSRRQVTGELTPTIADLIFRCLKGNRYARFDRLSERGKAVFIRAVMTFIDEHSAELIQAVHREDAHGHALREHEQQSVNWQARQDVVRFSGAAVADVASHFGPVRPGYCYVCRQRITPGEAYNVEISATLKADAHGSCCEKDPRFELLTEFSFRLIGGLR